MDRLPEEVNDLAPIYTLSDSRQNFDLKYQMSKHDMHANLFSSTKAFLCACRNNRCGQVTRKASSSSTNHSLPGIICWVSEKHRCNLFRAIETKNAAPLYWEVFKFQPRSYIPVSCRTFYFFSLFKILHSFCHEFRSFYEGATF